MDINLTLIMQAIGFGLFIWFCARYVWPPMVRAIEQRQKEIAEGLTAAEAGKQSLANAEKRIGEMMIDARGKASDIIAQGEKVRRDTVDHAKGEAQTEAERIIAAAKAEIEQEVARAKESLRNQVAELAVAGASKILRREVDPQAHADLLASIRAEL